MEIDEAAAVLAQLGNPARLAILRSLVRAGPEGLSVGAVGARVGLAPSTLAFHLRGLVAAGIVRQEKQGRVVMCRPCFAVLDEVTAFLRAECCADRVRSAPHRAMSEGNAA